MSQTPAPQDDRFPDDDDFVIEPDDELDAEAAAAVDAPDAEAAMREAGGDADRAERLLEELSAAAPTDDDDRP